jgi:hypothetical protein
LHVLQPEGLDVHAVAVAHAAPGQVRFLLQLFPALQVTSHLQELPQSTPPPQLPVSQPTVQEPGPQARRVEQAPAAHPTTQSDDAEQSTLPLQAPVSQVTAQGPAPQRTVLEHAEGPQVTAQLDERVQSMVLPQAPAPHSTEQGPGPHVMGVGQAFVPVQEMVQLSACVQSTRDLHAPAPQFT